MNLPFGQTRTRIASRHALIAPDGHVKSSVPGIQAASTVIHISPEMGARFSQIAVAFERGGRIDFPADGRETVGYVETGGAAIVIGERKGRLKAGSFFFAPAGESWSLTGPAAGTRLTLFQKPFEALAGGAGPASIIGDSGKVKGQPFLGDPDARLQVLLPDAPAFDLAMNVFIYEPGATLPFVETHIMEHGLLMLAGQGVYRLEDAWYPVVAGDVIWMASYCPQWFVAIGKTPAKYLYYKDVNRPAVRG
ncbi:MAG TPA: (S)-ureidoglycine aminohydrolase [Opitutaceae bacterium]|jgi:(S)-ureidoglycine aminohydrolase